MGESGSFRLCGASPPCVCNDQYATLALLHLYWGRMSETEIVVFDPSSNAASSLQAAISTDTLQNVVGFTTTGIDITDTLTLEQAKTLTRQIAQRMIQDAVEISLLRLCLGQIIIYAEARWGDMYSQWLDSTGLAYGTLANSVYVARNVDRSLWNENLDFGHHYAVAPLDDDEQRRWLTYADENNLGANELRRAIQVDKDKKEGKDPSEAEIERQLSRVAKKIRDETTQEQWPSMIAKGLLLPLFDGNHDDMVTLLEDIDTWRWNLYNQD